MRKFPFYVPVLVFAAGFIAAVLSCSAVSGVEGGEDAKPELALQQLKLYVEEGKTRTLTTYEASRAAAIPGVPGDILAENGTVIASIANDVITGKAEGTKDISEQNIRIYVTQVSSTAGLIIGDMNNDGIIDDSDRAAADINNDGVIDTKDDTNKNGVIDSADIAPPLPPAGTVATPVAIPPSGTYSVAQVVTFSCTTEGAVIFYTTDGSIPTKDSTACAIGSPITITPTPAPGVKLRAIAIKSQMIDSAFLEETYSKSPAVVAPTATPPGGAYGFTQYVTLQTTTNASAIFYTLDGSIPNPSNSTQYIGNPIPITPLESQSKVLRAIAVKPGSGLVDSIVMQATYTYVYIPQPPATGNVVNSQAKDLMIKFGVKTSGYTEYDQNDVTNTFKELHAYINNSEVFDADTDNNTTTSALRHGDYIDLPGLVVETASGYGQFYATTNTDLGAHGKQLRLMVVGINSFNRRATQPTNTPHVVFQFQNIPVGNRMYSSRTNTVGYTGSDLRAYLIENFFTGLKNAGVPDTQIFIPKRFISKGSGSSGLDEVSDTIWLPTEREMFGDGPWTKPSLSSEQETVENQAHLEYYVNDGRRIKYDPDNAPSEDYILASPYTNDAQRFCGVCDDGTTGYDFADTVNGISPAFCIK
jgi:hypothetical protein